MTLAQSTGLPERSGRTIEMANAVGRRADDQKRYGRGSKAISTLPKLRKYGINTTASRSRAIPHDYQGRRVLRGEGIIFSARVSIDGVARCTTKCVR
jgi:hypothetical protein